MSKTKCPRCGCKDLLITEAIEAYSEHRVVNGVWLRSHDNNEPGPGIRVDCKCMSCGYMWVGRKGVTIENYIATDKTDVG